MCVHVYVCSVMCVYVWGKIFFSSVVYHPTMNLASGETVELSGNTTFYSMDIAQGASLIQGTDNEIYIINDSTITAGTFTRDTGDGNFNLIGDLTLIAENENLGDVKVGVGLSEATFKSSFTAESFTMSAADLNYSATIYWAAGSTFTISTFTVNGNATYPLVLKSTSSDQWYLNNTSQNSVTYVEVSSSDANGGIEIDAGVQSVDLGNNENWKFASDDLGIRYWIASGAGNWDDVSNWSIGSGTAENFDLPLATHTVVFDSGGTGDATINTNVTITTLTVNGYTGTLDFNGYDITISSNFTQASGTVQLDTSVVTMGGDLIVTAGTFNAESSTITFESSMQGQTYLGQGETLFHVVSSNTHSNGLTFSSSFSATRFLLDANTLGSAAKVYFAGNSTFTITDLNLQGASGQYIFLRSTDATTQWFLNNTSTHAVAWVDVSSSNASPGLTIVPDDNSINRANNINWKFKNNRLVGGGNYLLRYDGDLGGWRQPSTWKFRGFRRF